MFHSWLSFFDSLPKVKILRDFLTEKLPYFAVYNAHPCFCAHYTQDYRAPYHTHGMYSYPCIMGILICPQKFGQESTHYTWQNTVL